MAERYAVASGNANAAATWDGGVSVPGAGDTAHANGFTVTITTNWTVDAITTAAGATAVAGGGFAINDGVTLNANVVAGTTTCLTPAIASTVTINGNVTAGTSAGARGIANSTSGTVNLNGDATGVSAGEAAVRIGGTAALVMVGDIIGGPGVSSTDYGVEMAAGSLDLTGDVRTTGSGYGLAITGSVTATILGNVIGGSSNRAMSISGGATVTVTGDVTGGTGSVCHGALVGNASAVLNVIGTVTGGSGSSTCTGVNVSNGTLNVTGDVIGGTTTSSNRGIRHQGSLTVTVTGDVTGSAVSAAIENASTGKVLISGDATAGSGASAVVNTSSGLISIGGNQIASSAGYAAIAGKVLLDDSNGQYIYLRSDSDGLGTVGSSREFFSYEKYAVGDGDWSEPAVWNCGTLPIATDYVFANGYTVLVNQTITVTRITTKVGELASTGGGSFYCDDPSCIINADVIAGTSQCLTLANTAGNFAINGNVQGGTTSADIGVNTSLSVGGTSTLTITGDVTGGGALAADGVYLLIDCEINGNLVGGSDAGACAVRIIWGGITLDVTGNVTGGTAGCGISAQAASTTTIIGDVTGGSGGSAHGAQATTSGANFNITGNVTGGTAASVLGISCTGASTLDVTGDVVGGTGGNAYGIQTGGSTITVIGNVTAGSAAHGIAQNGANSDVAVTGDVSATTASARYGIYTSHVTTLTTITGNVTPGTGGGNRYGFRTFGTAIVNGNISGGTSTSPGLFADSGSTVTVNGDANAGTLNSAIEASGTALVTVTGNLIANATGVAPMGGTVLCGASGKYTSRMNDAGSVGDPRSLYTLDAYPS